MDNAFFEHPILNSPYEYPKRHWQLDEQGQPTQRIIESRRRAEFITPIPKPRKRKDSTKQQEMIFDEGRGLSSKDQQYDPCNPTGSTIHVNFTTSKMNRYETDSRKCHINWVILDSDWEAEFCRVVEAHPKVTAYVKSHNLGLEVPYRYGSGTRKYIPDFVVLIDDGNEGTLHLIVEIKGYRGEDAKDKKATMENYWVPGVNNLGKYGRWAFVEFTDVFEIENAFNKMVDQVFSERS
ncbi:MAG: hypothetical protein KAU17_15035 [Spirochaetales bacterium]|jgi:hypothetical protein|nr:hypothetical protein [Spirochaetales bacterium]